MTQLAYPTLRSLYIEVFRDDTKAGGKTQGPSCATGFVVETKKGPHLVTNHHVVSGTNSITRSVCWYPTTMTIHHHKKGHPGKWVHRTEALTINDVPQWIEHPILASRADFVAIPLQNLDDVDLHCVDPLQPWYAYAPNDANNDFVLSPSDVVSIVGYPFGRSAGGYPIWVSGFLAAELSTNFEELPIQLIDSRTRRGQSGSPVFAYRAGGLVHTANGAATLFSGPVAKFLGIYSGRINEESDLGRVWRTEALAELIHAINGS